MTTIKTFSEFFKVYDFLKQWAIEGDIPEVEGGFQGMMGDILGLQAQHGIPVLYVSKAEKRYRAVMLGWPTEGMKEGESFPQLHPPCADECAIQDEEHVCLRPIAFFIKKMWISPKYAKSNLGFAEDILECWPMTQYILTVDKDGQLKEVWSQDKMKLPKEEEAVSELAQ